MGSINRKPHVLIREKTLAMPRHIIFFDTETTETKDDYGQSVQTLKMGWACYYRKAYGRNLEHTEWKYFDTPLDFWAFVYKYTKRKRKLWLISHNLSFDFTIVQGWKYLKQVGFKLKFFHNAGMTTIISVRGRFGSILLIDFMNYFRESLAAIGTRIGFPKLKIDFEKCSLAELSTYCKRDVEILLFAFKDFIKFLADNHISRLCYTIASTAMAAYLFSCYTHKIYIHNNSEAIDLERKSYRGGRVECFYIGDLNTENYYVLDVNSLYSTVMFHGFYPCKYKAIRHNLTVETLGVELENNSVIADCLIETDEPVYAVKRDWTIFPIGKFWTVLCTPELRYALEHDHIREIRMAVVYDQAPLFRRYVEKFYSLRMDFKKRGVKTYNEIVKLLLNSLYGKFGQKAEVWKKIGEAPNEKDRVEICFNRSADGPLKIRYLLGEVWELTGYEECFNSFPAIASHVAAYARMYLYKLLNIAGVGNYFYCDTDSIIVNTAGLENLKPFMNALNLGALKLEETTSSLQIRGLKDYSTDSKEVIKGIRKTAVKISDGVYSQQRWPSLKGLLSAGDPDTYTIKTERKILIRKYTKGIVHKDGSVSPLSLDDTAQPYQWLY